MPPLIYAELRDAWAAFYVEARADGDDAAAQEALDQLFPEPDFPSEGKRVAHWLAENVVQTKGRWARKPLLVEAWQYEFLCELYRLDPLTFERVYTEAFLLLPRKNGKSTLASGIGLYQLMADGEDAPEVYVAAGKRDQARAIHNQAKATVESSPYLHDYLRVFQNHIACEENGGVFKVLSSDAKMEHGSNPSANLIDEKWAHPNNDLTTALTSGTAARERPITLTVSTVGFDLDSALGEDFAGAMKLDDVETRHDGYLTIARDTENGFLFWHYGPPFDLDALRAGRGFHPTVDLEEPEVWRRSNPASWISTDYLRKQRMKPSVRLADFRRFHLNAWTDSEDLWLPEGAWAKLGDPDARLTPGAPTWLAVDMGQMHDAAAVVAIQATGEFVEGEDGEQLPAYVVEAVILTPAAGRPVDHSAVRAVIRTLAAAFEVVEVAYDPWRFAESATLLEDEGLPLVKFDQGNERMCPACERVYAAINSGRLRHNGDPEFAAHVNAGATVDCGERGWRLTKRKATRRIDALIALTFGLDRADKSDRHGSVYEERDVVVLG